MPQLLHARQCIHRANPWCLLSAWQPQHVPVHKQACSGPAATVRGAGCSLWGQRLASTTRSNGASTHSNDISTSQPDAQPSEALLDPGDGDIGTHLQGRSHALPAPESWAGMVASWPVQPLEPGLYVVGTPIGNLADITLRALSVLRSVNLILAEDTRHSLKLLNHFGIRSELMSCHEHNEQVRTQRVLQRLQQGEPVALISDAGMPGISDPGAVLISSVIKAGVKVVPIPGASAFVCALVASGLDTTSFTFIGFLPPKQGARRAKLAQIRDHTATLAFYTPPHGLCATLSDMVDVLGPTRQVCVARELTKRHEELFRSDLQGALEAFQVRQPRGEFCLIVEGAKARGTFSESSTLAGQGVPDASADGAKTDQAGANAGGTSKAVPIQVQAESLVRRLVAEGLSRSDAAKEAAKRLGLKKKELYVLASQLKGL